LQVIKNKNNTKDMKQKIYILGIITVLIIFVGTMFKVEHWPAAGILLTAGIGTLVIIFLPVALTNHYRTEGSRQDPILYLVTWLTCFVVFTAMLFKIQHWPLAGLFLLIALPFPYVVFLPVFLIVTSKNKNFNIYNTVFILLLMAGQSVFSVYLALGVSREKINNSLALSEHYKNFEKAIQALPVLSNNEPVLILNNKADELLKLVNECEGLMFKKAGITEEQWNNFPENIRDLDSRNVAVKVMLPDSEPTLATRLETSLKSYIRELEKTPHCSELAGVASVLFDIREQTEDDLPWAWRTFGVNYLSWALIYLDALKVNIITIKNEVSILGSGEI
jgi:hypothetical protein